MGHRGRTREFRLTLPTSLSCDPDELELGRVVEVVCRQNGATPGLPLFRPTSPADDRPPAPPDEIAPRRTSSPARPADDRFAADKFEDRSAITGIRRVQDAAAGLHGQPTWLADHRGVRAAAIADAGSDLWPTSTGSRRYLGDGRCRHWRRTRHRWSAPGHSAEPGSTAAWTPSVPGAPAIAAMMAVRFDRDTPFARPVLPDAVEPPFQQLMKEGETLAPAAPRHQLPRCRSGRCRRTRLGAQTRSGILSPLRHHPRDAWAGSRAEPPRQRGAGTGRPSTATRMTMEELPVGAMITTPFGLYGCDVPRDQKSMSAVETVGDRARCSCSVAPRSSS